MVKLDDELELADLQRTLDELGESEVPDRRSHVVVEGNPVPSPLAHRRFADLYLVVVGPGVLEVIEARSR